MDDIGRVAAIICILCISGIALYAGCVRSSVIYFFELNSSKVIFLELSHAVFFPIVLSTVLFALYKSDQRLKTTCLLEKLNNPANSKTSSRKVSRSRDLQKIDEDEENKEMTIRALKRMLTNLEEEELKTNSSGNSSKQSVANELPEVLESLCQDKEQKDEDTEFEEPNLTLETNIVSNLFEVKKESDYVSGGKKSCNRITAVAAASGISTFVNSEFDDSRPHSRASSVGSRNQLVERSRRNSLTEGSPCDIYRQLGQVDFLNYVLGVLNMIPTNVGYNRKQTPFGLADIFAEIIGTHVPIWLCVAAFHVALLELLYIKFAYYFYYHEEVILYAALAVSLAFGLVHEYRPNYVSNNILALSSIYVVVARLQTVSFQAACALVVLMALFDLFWLYVVDFLSMVKDSKAPFLIQIPNDNRGNKQSLATLDIIVPGLFLNLVLKYSSMYDPTLFMNCFYATYVALIMTMGFAIHRGKTTPAMVLPAIVLIGCSMMSAVHPYDLWRFMVKH